MHSILDTHVLVYEREDTQHRVQIWQAKDVTDIVEPFDTLIQAAWEVAYLKGQADLLEGARV